MSKAKASRKPPKRGLTPATLKELRTLVKELAAPDFGEEATTEKLRKLLAGGTAALQTEKAAACVSLGLAAKKPDVRWTVGYVAGPLLARHLGAGEDLDARLDALVGLFGVVAELRAMFARIPATRRKRIWAREFRYWAAHEDREQGRFLVDRFETELLSIAPEARPFIARYRAAVPPPEPKIPTGRRLFPPKTPGARYVFADPFIVNAGDWEDFDELRRKQLLLATARMTGKKVKTARAVARAIDEDMPDEFELRFWEIYAADPAKDAKPLFDCWVFTVDNAVFFKHDTLTRVRVYVLQDSFMEDDSKAASKQLAADLAASAPESLWAS